MRAASYPLKSISQALSSAYTVILAERGIDTKHDNIIFNWVNVLTKRCTDAKARDGDVDFMVQLKDILRSQDITIEPKEPSEDSTGRFDSLEPSTRKRKDDKRRVSFEDARYEETWLEEHTEPMIEQTPDGKPFSRRPPTPGRPFYNRRAHSADDEERDPPGQKPAEPVSQSTLSASDPDGPADSSILRASTLKDEEERDAQLQDFLGAFQEMSDIRIARRYTHIWHDSLIALSSRNQAAKAIATAHDERTLLRQAVDTWSQKTRTQVHERQQEEEFERLERKAVLYRSLMLAQKGFEHWHARHLTLKDKTERTNRFILAKRYFRRWRNITAENNAKARQLLTRKFLERWRDRTLRRQMVGEQAIAHYEEALERRLYKNWFWRFCSRKVEDLHDERVQKRALRNLSDRIDHVQDMSQQAERARSRRLLAVCVQALRSKLGERQQASTFAQAHYEHKARLNCMETLRIQGRLGPLEKTMSLRVTLTLQRKAFSVWHLHLSLTRQAGEVNRKRILQDAWTSWNDTLRVRALSQRIDERVLAESLYKWVLQERLSLFRRAADSRLARHAILLLDTAVHEYRSTSEDRAASFAENQRRRKLASSMVRLNLAFRQHEDAERTAVEFANSRALPDVLSEWKEKTKHARELAKWAADARWYCLASSAIKTWRARTTEHQHQRRREAYVQIRARVKYKMASKCFTVWRIKSMDVHSMQQEAQRRAQARLFAIGTNAFDKWHHDAQAQRDREVQAASIDDQRLLAAALSAMLTRHSESVQLEQSALAFRLGSDQALQASVLKLVQWTAFTAAQQSKSADALFVRNRDQHVRNMLKHWYTKAAAARAAKTDPAEPESPSIRPASRAAARSASKERFSPSKSVSYTPGTPGYMRTPSRSRRAGRFRPIPTPAAVTPFAFGSGYMTTTPAPLTARDGGINTIADVVAGLTPQVTPFARKLRAGGFNSMPPSALRTSVMGRSGAAPGTAKSVRFARAGRFAQSTAGRIEDPLDAEEGDFEQEVHFKSS